MLARTIQALGKAQRRLRGAWYGMAVARVLHTAIRDAEPGRLGMAERREQRLEVGVGEVGQADLDTTTGTRKRLRAIRATNGARPAPSSISCSKSARTGRASSSTIG